MSEILEPGMVYSHRKGNIYIVIGMAMYSVKYKESTERFVLYTDDLMPIVHSLAMRFPFIVEHSESEELLVAYRERGNDSWLLIPSVIEGKSLGYVREITNFKELVEVEGNFINKFELVAEKIKEFIADRANL
jgi:hypothetical protein